MIVVQVQLIETYAIEQDCKLDVECLDECPKMEIVQIISLPNDWSLCAFHCTALFTNYFLKAKILSITDIIHCCRSRNSSSSISISVSLSSSSSSNSSNSSDTQWVTNRQGVVPPVDCWSIDQLQFSAFWISVWNLSSLYFCVCVCVCVWRSNWQRSSHYYRIT